MRRPTLQMLIFLSAILPVLLIMTGVPTSAKSPTGVTPTIGPGAGTPVPVGGHLALVDRGAVLQATFGPLVWPLVTLVMLVGIIGFVVMHRRAAV